MSKYCPNCGAKTTEGVVFCGECGLKLSISTTNSSNSTSNKSDFQNEKEESHFTNKIVEPIKKKKRGCLKTFGIIILSLLAIIIIGSIILYNLDDWEKPSNTAIFHEPASLKTATTKMENIFKEADTTQLKLLLTDTSFETYKDVYAEIEPYMSEYAKAFKSRKLIKKNEIFALYSFEDEEGNIYTVEFIAIGKEEWKLTRF